MSEQATPWWRRVVAKAKADLPESESTLPFDAKTVIVLLVSTLALTLLWYYGRLPFYREKIAPWLFSEVEPVKKELYGYYYLAFSSVVTRMLIPLAIILFIFKQTPRDFGYRVRGTWRLGLIYLGLLAFMLPLLYYASGLEAFQKKYPLYDYAAESLTIFLVYEISYVLVFLSGESFWRGFMVFGLARKFGLYSLIIMAIPYAMIHFGKPFIESLGAIAAGMVLGYIALKHKSFWLGVALHSTIGITMDLLVLWRTGRLGPLFGFE